MSINDFDRLKNKILSDFNFVDASKIIWQIRMIKSQEEIKKIKDIILIASNVFDEFVNHIINIGMTEIEICNIFKKQLLQKGADHTLIYVLCFW